MLGASTVKDLPLTMHGKYLKHVPKFDKTFHLGDTDAYEVVSVIKNLAPKTSAGYDLLFAKMLHNVAE